MTTISPAQNAYDRIRAHFTFPGVTLAKRSREEFAEGNGPLCFYRQDGSSFSPTRCAVGALIPDEMYDPEMDGTGTLSHVLDHWPEIMPALGIKIADGSDPVYEFICEAQLLHDDNSTYSVEQFVNKLDDLAHKSGLVVSGTPSREVCLV